jgi:hypothetical protein
MLHGALQTGVDYPHHHTMRRHKREYDKARRAMGANCPCWFARVTEGTNAAKSFVMHRLRAFFLHHRRLAALLVALALVMKALVPAGYMLGTDTRVLTVQICADSVGHMVTKQITVGQKTKGGQKADAPCAFAAYGQAMMGGTDPIQLALALLFVLALGFAPIVPVARRAIAYQRPPLRGPPALA